MAIGSLVSVIVVLVILGLVLYLIETYIPMSPPFKMILRVIVVIALCLYLLSAFGVMGGAASHGSLLHR